MHTEFRRAIVPKELRALAAFDNQAFIEYPDDRFDPAAWQTYEAWWLIVAKRKAGCCALALDTDFNLRPCRGSLYVASTGVLPDYQRMGFGALLKAWQISYARRHGFTRVVTNTRKSNRAMIELNRKFGFKIVRTMPGYYQAPREATVVMERQL